MSYKVGDLVWCKIGTYPDWPGQVMDPKTAVRRVQEGSKPNTTLVCFFGDNSHAWVNHTGEGKKRVMFPLNDEFDSRSVVRKGSLAKVRRLLFVHIAELARLQVGTLSMST
jgi:PWWP domain